MYVSYTIMPVAKGKVREYYVIRMSLAGLLSPCERRVTVYVAAVGMELKPHSVASQHNNDYTTVILHTFFTL